MVLLAYRPGGPVDLLVGLAALLPLPVSLLAVFRPPLVRGQVQLAGVFWLGLLACLLLIPSIIDVGGQVQNAGTEPLLPSVEDVYPWALALLATGLFAGLGVTRRASPEVRLSRRRVVVSLAFALGTASLIAGLFAGVSLLEETVSSAQAAGQSRFGPTDPEIALPQCHDSLRPAGSVRVDLQLSADVDGTGIGSVSFQGSRSDDDFEWHADVAAPSGAGHQGAVRIGSEEWSLEADGEWASLADGSTAETLPDVGLVDLALSQANRATAEDHGVEVVEGARARHCRVAIDGATFKASIPQVTWLTGGATLRTWRGEVDYWIFGDGEIGKASGSVNGDAAEVGRGLQGTVRMSLTATYRDTRVSIAPPTSQATSQPSD